MRFFRSLPVALAGGAILLGSPLQAAPAKPAPAKRSPAAKPAAAKPAPAAKRPAQAPESPDQVVRDFLKAQQAGDDEKAYALLSAEAKKRYPPERWQDQGRQVRLTFAAINILVGDTLLVGGAANAQNNVAGSNIKGDGASVQITHMVPIKNTVHLVKENGRWKIDIHRSLSIDSAPAPAPKPQPAPPTPQPPTPPPAPDYSNLCQGNLRQLATAFRVYALDHNGQLPNAAKWTDEILPYVTSPSVFKCPPDTPAESSFAMNAALSNAKLAEVENPGNRVLLYETTTPAKNVSGRGETQPASSPYPKGYLVLFANGDVAFRMSRPEVK